jgi:hypothetical protein
MIKALFRFLEISSPKEFVEHVAMVFGMLSLLVGGYLLIAFMSM